MIEILKSFFKSVKNFFVSFTFHGPVTSVPPAKEVPSKNDFDAGWNDAVEECEKAYENNKSAPKWQVLGPRHYNFLKVMTDGSYFTQIKGVDKFNKFPIWFKKRGTCLYTFKFYGSCNQNLMTDVFGESLWEALDRFVSTIQRAQDLIRKSSKDATYLATLVAEPNNVVAIPDKQYDKTRSSKAKVTLHGS